MKMRIIHAIFLFCVGAIPALAQTDAIEGTWSGSWIPEGGVRDAVTVRFDVDGDTVRGEMVNPENIEFSDIAFNDETLRLVAAAESSESGPVRVEARVEEETRLNGTLTYDSTSGVMRLTKWTYVPRIR